ncbi:MAG: lipase-like domain-containing protein [Candidatus Fimenecus sp.]
MATKIVAFVFAVIMFLSPASNHPNYKTDLKNFKTNYTCVYVHGIGGWGEYDLQNNAVAYWGTLGGNLMEYLNARGFNCVAASVSPVASCWDRACELYAQLTGTRTDYGKHHSEKYKHARYGPDYTGRPLIEKFSEKDKINLLGHSFGGATILQFLDLMADGSAEEIAATPKSEISSFFTGGKADWVYSITTLASPLNGSTAYYLKDEISQDKNATLEEWLVAKVVGNLTEPLKDGRDPRDCAGYDMEVDRARELCRSWETQKNVYYFSLPCNVTKLDENNERYFENKDVEFLFRGSANRIMKWTGKTPSGFVLDESWQANDGLVNTVSAIAPYNAPRKAYNPNNISSGIWNVLPTYHGDHLAITGGLLNTNNVRLFYAEHLSMINSL